MKTKEKRKQKIKDISLRIVHILSYVLSALFLVVCIVAGVKSCNNKKQTQQAIMHLNNALVLDEPNGLSYVYTNDNIGRVDMSFDWVQNFDTYYGLGGGQNSQASVQWRTDLFDDGEYYLYYEGEYKKAKGWSIRFDIKQYIANAFYMYYPTAWLVLEDDTRILYFSKENAAFEDGDDFAYVFEDDIVLIASTSSTTDFILYSYFSRQSFNASNFTLNRQINYNAPANGSYNQAFIVSPLGSHDISIDLPLFISAGQIFNRLTFQYIDADSTRIKVNDEVIVNDVSGYYFAYLKYENTITGTNKTVNYRNYGDITVNGSYATYVDYGSYWVDERYRTLNFQTELSVSDLDKLYPLNNTTAGDYGYTNNNVGIGGAFDLLGMAFNSLIGIMSINVLPGLTLGLFIFLPLVATIIVLVFKAVRK